MPVVVTGANGRVGRALIPLLVEKGSEVRAVVRRPEAAEELRTLGAKVAVADLSDDDRLAVAFRDAHTVCHLAGTADLASDDLYESVNAGTARSVVEAARRAGVNRFLYLSYPGASPDSTNAYLRSKGLAEESIRESGLAHLILRCTHMIGPGSRWLEGMTEAAHRPVAPVIGSGTQRVAPVFAGDVTRVLAAADDRAVEVKATLGLEGSESFTVDQVVDLLAGKRKRKLHLSGNAARFGARLLGRRLSPALVEVMAADSLADAPDAAAEFGVAVTPFREALGRSLPEGFVPRPWNT